MEDKVIVAIREEVGNLTVRKAKEGVYYVKCFLFNRRVQSIKGPIERVLFRELGLEATWSREARDKVTWSATMRVK